MLFGIFEVYMGFVFFGVAYFAAFSDLFKDPDAASVTLFALLNGDVIHDVFDAIYDASPVVSRVYLYSFIMLFIYAVLNIFIAIVEDAFFAAKRYFVEDLKKDMEDRNKRPQDMDILGIQQLHFTSYSKYGLENKITKRILRFCNNIPSYIYFLLSN